MHTVSSPLQALENPEGRALIVAILQEPPPGESPDIVTQGLEGGALVAATLHALLHWRLPEEL